jgi:hypothetical protein
MREVFASYSRHDQSKARLLVSDIESLGCNVWLDQRLSGGEQWWRAILQRVRACDIFLFAISEHSLSSKACRLECDYAIALGKPILPVLLDAELSANLLPGRLALMQVLQFKAQSFEWALSVGRAVRNLPPCPPLPVPLPDEPSAPLSYLADLRDSIDAPGELDFSRQSSVLLRIKGGLRDSDPDTAAGAVVLLQKFRARRDLLAEVATEVDDTLATWARQRTTPLPPRRPRRTAQLVVAGLVVSCVSVGVLASARFDGAGALPAAHAVRDPPKQARPALHDAGSAMSLPPRSPALEPAAARKPGEASKLNAPTTGELDPKRERQAEKTADTAKPARKLSPQLAAFQGKWNVSWQDHQTRYRGLLSVTGRGAKLRLSYQSHLDGQTGTVTEPLTIEEKEGQLVLQGRSPRALVDGVVDTSYEADHIHVLLGDDRQARAMFCDPSHDCFMGVASLQK